jgi:hypothetical protein
MKNVAYKMARRALFVLRKPLNHLAYANQIANLSLFYSQFIRQNDLCFDIGANLGNQTDAFLKLGVRVGSS